MPKQRLSPEELSRIRSENGRKGALTRMMNGKCRGGRPKGTTKDPATAAEPVISISVATSDREVLRRYAYRENTTLKGAFHKLMEILKPQLEKV